MRRTSDNKIVCCDNCGIEFSKKFWFDATRNSIRNYCGNVCRRACATDNAPRWTPERKAAYAAANTGINNSNYGNNWSIEQRTALSEKHRIRFAADPSLAVKCGASNRGVKFSVERIEAMHAHRPPGSYGRARTDAEKILIGERSSAKWTPEYKEQHRARMEECGKWVPLAQVDQYKVYFRTANWVGTMNDFLTPLEQLQYDSVGKFHPWSNSRGMVRDHILPRKIGYELNVPVQLLRHPANMQLLLHTDNVKKGRADRLLTEQERSSRLYELIDKILSFDKLWKEHEVCLQLIKENYA